MLLHRREGQPLDGGEVALQGVQLVVELADPAAHRVAGLEQVAERGAGVGRSVTFLTEPGARARGIAGVSHRRASHVGG